MIDTPACKSCRFWQKYDNYGNCKRYPPHVDAAGQSMAPVTSEFDWCGEHQPLNPKPQ